MKHLILKSLEMQGFKSFPDKIKVYIGYNNVLAHQVEAGCDLFMMPSRFEPCGLNQMYSLLYGTLPIVHATGGLVDTVQNYNEQTGEGTGFMFDSIPYIVLAPVDILIILASALINYIICYSLNHKKQSEA